jgi:hypothetical protein
LGIEVGFVGRFDETPGLRRSHPQHMTFSQDKNNHCRVGAPRASLVIPPQVSALSLQGSAIPLQDLVIPFQYSVAPFQH